MLTSIDLHSMFLTYYASNSILQNIFSCVQQNKETPTLG